MGLLDPGVAMYVAAAVALSVWVLLFAYLWRLDRRAAEMQRALEREEQAPTQQRAPLRPVRADQEQRANQV